MQHVETDKSIIGYHAACHLRQANMLQAHLQRLLQTRTNGKTGKAKHITVLDAL